MKKTKEKYLEFINKIKNLIKDAQTSEQTISLLDKIQEDIEKFKIYVPLVGNFSAGKSSILNSFLEDEILPYDTLAETTIATELHYGEKTQLEAINFEGLSVFFSVDQIGTLKPDKFKYLKLYVNKPELDMPDDIVLVDMPGLDSGIEAHNQAILQYIRIGVSYIIVIDSEDGSLKRNTISFLKEINQYNLDYYVLINKSDKKPADEIDKIKDIIKEQVSTFGKLTFVGSISAHFDEINDFFEILKKIDKVKSFKSVFDETLFEIIGSIITGLEIRIKSLDKNTSELDDVIYRLEKSREELMEAIENEEREINRKFSENTVESILSDVKNELRNNSFSLASALKTSKDAFKREVNEIIRPVLVQVTAEHIQIVFDHSINSYEEKFETSMNILGAFFDKNQSDILIDKVGKLAESFDGAASKLSDVSPKVNYVYKSFAGSLALVTTIVAPWLEIVIFFLPEILSFIYKLLKNEDDEVQKLKEHIEFSIIPDIVNKLKPQVKSGLNEAKLQFINDLKLNAERKSNELISSIQQVKNEKAENDNKISEKKKFMVALKEQLVLFRGEFFSQ